MYKVYWDSFLLHDLVVPEEEGYYLNNPILNEEVNKVAELTFDIYPTHPVFDRLEKLVPNIIITKNDRTIFKGRIIKEKQNMDNSKQVTCESVLAFLLDSIQRPFEFQGSPKDLFIQLINYHNEQVEEYKRFKIGKTTGANLDNNEYINRSSESYLNTWNAIETRLLNIGGYLLVRYEEDGNYIDWVDDFADGDMKYASTQTIEFGENLIDITVENDGADIYTVVIPLGVETEHEDGTKTRLTIASENDGKDYLVNEEALKKYGWIVAPIEDTTWDDVTVVSNLKRKGQQLLDSEGIYFKSTLELSAIDLNVVDGSIDSFEMNEYIKAQSTPHNISKLYLLTKKQTPLSNPENMKITLGENKNTLTGMQLGDSQSIKEGMNTIIKNYQTNIPKMKQEIKELQESVSIDNTIVMYYLSSSYKELKDGEWVDTPPEWVDGKYYWQKNVTTFSDGTTTETTPICLTGGTGATGKDGQDGKDGTNGTNGTNGTDGKGVKSIVEQYYKSTSATSLSGGSWSTTYPGWENGKYIWTRSIITYTDNTTTTTTAICVTGGKGETGANGKDGNDGQNGVDGVGIESITTEFYLSTSKTEQTGGSWGTTMPEWSKGMYLWTRNKIVYSNSTTDYTEPVCDSSWEAVNDAEESLNNTIIQVQRDLLTSIEQNEESIRLEVAEQYYNKENTNQLISEQRTALEQTKNSFNMTFEGFNTELQNLNDSTNAKFEEYKKYIRFEDGKILLGEVGNQLELEISNDRISFLQSGYEVAYLSNNKLYVTDGEYTNSLRVGKFAFIPRANGSLDFKKVGD